MYDGLNKYTKEELKIAFGNIAFKEKQYDYMDYEYFFRSFRLVEELEKYLYLDTLDTNINLDDYIKGVYHIFMMASFDNPSDPSAYIILDKDYRLFGISYLSVKNEKKMLEAIGNFCSFIEYKNERKTRSYDLPKKYEPEGFDGKFYLRYNDLIKECPCSLDELKKDGRLDSLILSYLDVDNLAEVSYAYKLSMAKVISSLVLSGVREDYACKIAWNIYINNLFDEKEVEEFYNLNREEEKGYSIKTKINASKTIHAVPDKQMDLAKTSVVIETTDDSGVLLSSTEVSFDEFFDLASSMNKLLKLNQMLNLWHYIVTKKPQKSIEQVILEKMSDKELLNMPLEEMEYVNL